MINIVDDSNYDNYIVGTKAYQLFLARANGILVPNLFAISPKDLNDRALATVMEEYISVNYRDTPLFSVRSACLAEDGKLTSFAGQFDTFLNVGPKAVMDHIKKCLESLASPNVLEYCRQQKVDVKELTMSVIVQEMVTGQVSGVLFTANPQGILNETVIVIGSGSGDGVVEEKVPTTTYYYNLADKLYYYESQEGAPIIEKSVIDELLESSEKLKTLFGSYLDIEFTIDEGKLYILQIRPITTLKEDRQTILDNSNIVESYPGISLPLTQSFIEYAYYGVFKGLAYRCLRNKKLVEQYEPVLNQMVGSANGRVYYKISNWYTVIKFLPFSKKIIPVWQEMMGVSVKEHNQKKNDISWLQRVRVYINAFYEAFHVQKGMEKLNDSFDEVETLFLQNYTKDLSNQDLVKLYDIIGEAVLKDWDITLLNDMYGFVYTGLLKNKLKKRKIENYEEVTNQYISGITNIESMKPVRELIALAKYALDSGAIAELQAIKQDTLAADYFENNRSEFAKRFENYIRLYGDRTVEELKLETKTFRTSPILLLKKILTYAEDGVRLEELYNALHQEKQELSSFALQGCSRRHIKSIQKLSSHAMRGIKNREISRLNRSRIYGMVRTIFLTMGTNMVREDQLNKAEDIFYLYTKEIFDYIKGGSYDFKSLTVERKAKFSMFMQLPAYTRLIFSGNEFDKTPVGVNAAVVVNYSVEHIIGTPCSNGTITGEVLVIEDAKEAFDVKNKILVTKMTDPGWVFLLTMAKGIIAEKGSLLSHTAIISRELGIPSIVGVKNITNLLKNGDIITMNGSTGEIRVESGRL